MTRSRFSILFKWFMGLCKGPTPSWALITRRELMSLQGLCVLCVFVNNVLWCFVLVGGT